MIKSPHQNVLKTNLQHISEPVHYNIMNSFVAKMFIQTYRTA